MNPIPVHAFNPGPYTGDGNWTWLIRGRVTTLIDAGTGDERHLDALVTALAGSRLDQVLVTHAHVDHASGAPAIAARFPQVRFLKMSWPERDDKWPVTWEPIAADDLIAAGDTTLRAVHTPGHAPDHVCFWHEETRTLFCGDLAAKGTTIFIPSNHRGDLTEYLQSLERVMAMQPARLLPAHGPVIDDPETLLRGYLEHRRERDEQILAALRQGDSDPDAIVQRVYPSIKEDLRPLARESVLSHLLKLERERRAQRADDAWHIIEP